MAVSHRNNISFANAHNSSLRGRGGRAQGTEAIPDFARPARVFEHLRVRHSAEETEQVIAEVKAEHVSTFEHLACSEEEGLLRTLFRRLERDKAANDGTYDGGPKLRYVDDFV